MPPIKLTVSGKGDEQKRPERALLSILVSSTGTDQTQVSEDVRIAAIDVTRQIKAMCTVTAEGGLSSSSAVEEWSTGSLATSSYDEKNRGGGDDDDDRGKVVSRLKKYRASLSLKARFRDFARLSELTTSLSVAKHVSVDEVRWILLEETRLALEHKAIESAYAAAHGKALAYARSMGRKTVTPVEVCDKNTLSAGFVLAGRGRRYARNSHVVRYAHRDMAHDDYGDYDDDDQEEGGEKMLTYEPESVSCSSSCDVIYEIS